MNIFGLYSQYYDLLYQDKPYNEEVKYIDQLIKRYSSHAKTILDLGCGTGIHANLLSQLGYSVTGIDKSSEMINKAKHKFVNIDSQSLDFHTGDIRSLRLGKIFDVIISLFHVVSYQTTNIDLFETFRTVTKHLDRNGIFIFDCWYGPAVFASRPEVRIKRIKDNNLSLTRIAEPFIDVNTNTVDVKYLILLKEIANGKTEEFHETHKMRYFFIPEIVHYLSTVGFEYLDAYSWMHETPPDEKNWGAVFIAKPS